MPRRKVILATGETYHIFNKTLYGRPLFNDKRESKIFLASATYYLQPKPPVKFSIYRRQPDIYKVNLENKLVNVIAYCLMPNHYHFIATQLRKNGIRRFVQRFTNSYSHYFNIRNNQKGTLFENKFKTVRVEDQNQLIHLSRYIHLNPVTGYLVEDPADYDFSSYNFYLGHVASDLVDPSDVMVDFSSTKEYEDFVLDQKDYQRELKRIEHLLME
jgi:putative transposase